MYAKEATIVFCYREKNHPINSILSRELVGVVASKEGYLDTHMIP